MRSIAISTAVLLITASPLAAQSEDVLFGLRAGVVDVSGFDVGDATIDTDLSPSVGGFFDFGFGPLSAGVYADVHGLTGDFDDREYMLDAGGALKASLGGRGSRAFLRPGVGVGYGTVDIDGGATFLTTRGTLEVVVPQAGGMSWVFEGGAYWAPTGDTEGADVEFGPGLLLRAGIQF